MAMKTRRTINIKSGDICHYSGFFFLPETRFLGLPGSRRRIAFARPPCYTGSPRDRQGTRPRRLVLFLSEPNMVGYRRLRLRLDLGRR
jgi:hypothetical protein